MNTASVRRISPRTLALLGFLTETFANLRQRAHAFLAASSANITKITAHVLSMIIPAPARIWTREEKLKLAIDALKEYGDIELRVLNDIERKSAIFFRFWSTRDTVLEPIVLAFNAAGIKTRPTVGAVMRKLELSKKELHDAFCYCVHHHRRMPGGRIAQYLKAVT